MTVSASPPMDERIKTVLTDAEEELAAVRRFRERVCDDVSRLQFEGEEALQKIREVMRKKAEGSGDEDLDAEGAPEGDDEGDSEGDEQESEDAEGVPEDQSSMLEEMEQRLMAKEADWEAHLFLIKKQEAENETLRNQNKYLKEEIEMWRERHTELFMQNHRLKRGEPASSSSSGAPWASAGRSLTEALKRGDKLFH